MKKIVREALDRYAESQLNIASPTARELLAEEIERALKDSKEPATGCDYGIGG